MATVVLVAWGALAFGSPYAWAYVPLALGCTALGLVLFWRARHVSVPRIGDGPVLAALTLFAGCASLQLGAVAGGPARGPEPGEHVPSSKPSTSSLRSRRSRRAAPLSVAPAHGGATATLRSLALCGAFTLLLAGLTSFFSRESLAPLAPPLLGFGLLLAFVGIVQKAMLGDHAWGGMRIYGFWEPQYKLTTPFGPFVNKNHFAGWMLMAIPLGARATSSASPRRHARGCAEGGDNRLLWLRRTTAATASCCAFATVIMARVAADDDVAVRDRAFVVAMAIAADLAVPSPAELEEATR